MGAIIECGVNFLSFERAKKLVPPEFITGFEWYLDREGEVFSRLPHRDNNLNTPSCIKVSADRGIHSPNYQDLESKGAGKPRYVLKVHSSAGKGFAQSATYNDRDIIYRPDGTWVLDYCAHESSGGKRKTENGNTYLMNNLIDGIPVAVMVPYEEGGYKNLGLAYVERYDPLTHMFTLHGPVSAEKSNSSFFSFIPFDQLSPAERKLFEEADSGDERKRVLAEQIRRERQGAFRKKLFEAYDGTCSATGVNVPQVLQAAHIDPYRGAKSQVVTNGLLLRSDIHLLYDSHLLTVKPDSYEIRTSRRLQGTVYEQYKGQKIRLPKDPAQRPSDNLLSLDVAKSSTTPAGAARRA